MTDPATLARIGSSGTMFGTGLNAAGSVLGGIANRDMYNYQAGVARINAQIARNNAMYSEAQGEMQGQQYGMKAAQQKGKIQVAQAANGIDINSGSNRLVQESQDLITRMDTSTIRNNAARLAYNYNVQGAMYDAQASAYRAAGQNSLVAGVIGGLSSFVSGVGAVSNRWLQANQVGLGGANSLSGVSVLGSGSLDGVGA